MKTSDLIGLPLDWAVATCLGYTNLRRNPHQFDNALLMDPHRVAYGPAFLAELMFSKDWAQGGPIIEREKITLIPMARHWEAHAPDGTDAGIPLYIDQGPTPLIAAMRCFVASKLGDEVEIPKELM